MEQHRHDNFFHHKTRLRQQGRGGNWAGKYESDSDSLSQEDFSEDSTPSAGGLTKELVDEKLQEKNPEVTVNNPRNIIRLNLKRYHLTDVYFNLLKMSWPALFATILSCYIITAMIFSLLFCFEPQGVRREEALPNTTSIQPNLVDLFCFSLAVVMSGNGESAGVELVRGFTYTWVLWNMLNFLSVLAQAIITGLIFARFAKPTSRIRFSKKMVVSQPDAISGDRTLFLRVANERENDIIQPNIQVVFSATEEGKGHQRRFFDLNLRLSNPAVLPAVMTVQHTINKDSPLYGLSIELLKHRATFFHVVITGLDSEYMNSTYAFQIYYVADIGWDSKFKDMISPISQEVVIDFKHFDIIEPA